MTPATVARLDDIGVRLRDLVATRADVAGYGPFFRVLQGDVDLAQTLAGLGVLIRSDGTGSVCTETTQADLEALADALDAVPSLAARPTGD